MINSKKYIGQSNNINYRWIHHKWCLNNNCHSNSYLQRAWNKYGEKYFKFYIIEKCDSSLINNKEMYYIDLYKTMVSKNGYNLDSGGNLNKKHSEITKIKISRANTGRKVSDLTRFKISKNRKGKMTGKSHFMYGKHHSDETKKKLSESLVGRFVYDEHYGAMSVICITTNKIFTTIKAAGEYYNTEPVNISKCCKGKRNYSGKLNDGTILQWSYYKEEEEYFIKEYKRKLNNKPVSQYDLNNNFIATFESAREAEYITGIGYKMISRVCNGKRPHTHNYIWRFTTN